MDNKNEIVARALEEIILESAYYTKNGPGTPRLLVMSGLPMSGKSHLSNMIFEKMGGKVCIVRTDAFRPIVAKHMGRSQPMYDKNEHIIVFEVGCRLISVAISKGCSVIADATNLTDNYRKWAVDAAREHEIPVLVASLEIRPDIAMDRAREKDRNGSAATPAVYALLSYEKEPIDKCSTPYIVINSEVDIRPWGDMLAKWLEGSIDAVVGTVTPKPSAEPTAKHDSAHPFIEHHHK